MTKRYIEKKFNFNVNLIIIIIFKWFPKSTLHGIIKIHTNDECQVKFFKILKFNALFVLK